MLTPSMVSPSTTAAKLHVKNHPSSDSLYGSSYVNILSQTKDLAATTRNMNLVNQAITQESHSSLLQGNLTQRIDTLSPDRTTMLSATERIAMKHASYGTFNMQGQEEDIKRMNETRRKLEAKIALLTQLLKRKDTAQCRV